LITIPGLRRAGMNAAHGNMAIQLPLIAAEFPEVANCHHGTINVELAAPLFVVGPDHRTRAIHWDDAGFPDGEVFDLLRIQFEAPHDAPVVDAWLYIPHGSPHRRTPFMHEIIAPHLNIPAGVQCRIRIDRHAVQLPYGLFPAVVVI
jgi:hypothetical protein